MTFAYLSALEPRVTKIVVASITAILKPRAAASTTTAFAGFIDSTTLGAPVGAAYDECCRCGCFCGNTGAYVAHVQERRTS